jgi:hypothetical protein
MKKLGLLALVLGMIVAFAVPAMSFTIEGAKGEKMYIGGVFMTDIGYFSRSKEITGTGTDQTQFVMAVPNHSRLHGSLEVGNVGGYWEFGMGGVEANTSGAYNTSNNYVETRLLYGWYKFGNCELRAGKDHGYYYSVVPSQYFGLNWDLHVFGYGWGNVYDTREPQLRFTQNVTKEFGYMITLMQPAVFVDPSVAGAKQGVSYSQVPRVAAKVMMNFGMVSLYPAGQWQYAKWDNLNQTAAWTGKSVDDNMTSWQLLLPVVLSAGPFKGTAQFYYGNNSAPMYGGFASAFHAYGRDANGTVKTTTDMAGFINLAYTVGAATPAIYFGYDNAKNSDIYKGPTGDDNNTRMMYGASVNIKIAEGFFVIPEFTWYDYGKYPAGTALANKDVGKEWLGGVQFMFVF